MSRSERANRIAEINLQIDDLEAELVTPEQKRQTPSAAIYRKIEELEELKRQIQNGLA